MGSYIRPIKQSVVWYLNQSQMEAMMILIVAHSDLILEQWRRAFEKHLNIPQERTKGSDDITLQWGRFISGLRNRW